MVSARELTCICGENLLGCVSANKLTQLGLLVEIILRLIAWSEAQSVGLALLLLAGRGSIRLLMMDMILRRRGATAWLAVVVVVVVMVTALVVMMTRALLGVVVVEASSSTVTPVLLELAVIALWGTRHCRCSGLRISRIRSWRVRTRALMRSVWLRRITIAHWSTGLPRRAVVKTHPDRWAHRLSFGSMVVMASSASTSAELLMRLVVRGTSRRWRAPLLRRTTWLLRWRIWLSIGLVRRGAVRRLLLLCLLLWTVGSLLLVQMLSVIRVVVLCSESWLARVVRMLLLSLVRPLRLVLGIATRAWLMVLSRRILRVLSSVRLGWVLWRLLHWLLGVPVRSCRIIIGSASRLMIVVSSSSSSSTMTPTATSILVRWVLWISVRSWCRWRSGRRGAVVVCHADS